MGIQNRFSQDDPYVLTTQISTSNNNQASLSATIAETDFLRGSPVTASSQGVIKTIGTPFPTVATAAENTTGAALGNVGQSGTASQTEPNSGGIPCFAAETLILIPDGQKFIKDIMTGKDKVLCFDENGNIHESLVTAKFEHYYHKCYEVEFETGDVTHTTQEHRYWLGKGFVEIQHLDFVKHWNGKWNSVAIRRKEIIERPIVLYNLTVEGYNTYFANGDAVHNLKPLP